MRNSHSKKRPVTATAVIEKLSHDGRGIARLLGKATFIEGALPEETVTFAYTRRKSDFDEGRLLTVEIPSSLRVTPHCPHYALCGGCSLQHLSSEAQIQAKQILLLDVLARIGHCRPMEVLSAITDNPWNYRHKARLSVRYVEKKGATLLGFREKSNPRYITDIHTCPVLHAKVAAAIDGLRELLDMFEDKRSIAQIELAAGDDEVALIFRHLSPLNADTQGQLLAFAIKTQFRVYMQPAGPESVELFYPPDAPEYLTYRLPEFGLVYHFHPSDFTQVNSGINRKMVKRAVDLLALQPEDKVLDLFCGLGNFSLPIAQHCQRVVGIEGSALMIERARHNARLNQLTNVEFACANLETWSLANPLAQGVTKLLLDPPRCGALGIVKQIQLLNLDRIVYVSCNPVTLARDAAILVSQGYRLDAAGVMDMFPHTSHVESIALFMK